MSSKDTYARRELKKLKNKLNCINNKCCEEPASRTPFDNTISGTGADNVQDIIDELGSHEKLITYYEVVAGTSSGDQVTVPTNGTIILDKFGESKDAILSTVDGSGNVTWKTPRNAGGDVVTTSMAVDGTYVFSSTPVDATVAVIYVFRIRLYDLASVDLGFVISEDELGPTAEDILAIYPRQIKIIADRNNPNVTDQYLRNGANGMPMNLVGETLPWDATLVKIIFRTNGAETCTAEVRKNNLAGIEASASLAASDFVTVTTSVDFDIDDEVQVYLDGTNINRPKVILIFEER